MAKGKVVKSDLIERARRSAKNDTEEAKEEITNDYSNLDEQYVVRDLKFIQYASAYFVRLEELRPLLKETSTLKWKHTKIMDEIVGLNSAKQASVVIIGTLFKEMKLKPALVLDMVAILGK